MSEHQKTLLYALAHSAPGAAAVAEKIDMDAAARSPWEYLAAELSRLHVTVYAAAQRAEVSRHSAYTALRRRSGNAALFAKLLAAAHDCARTARRSRHTA